MSDSVSIRCEIEIKVFGPNRRTAQKWSADVLRTIADRLERGGYAEGETLINDHAGRLVGEISVRFFEGE